MVRSRVFTVLVAAYVAAAGCKSKRADPAGDSAPGAATPAPVSIIAPIAARRGAGRGELIERARQADRIDERLEAIRGLGRVGDAPSVAALVALLDDGDERVRAAAVEALALTGESSAAPAVAGTLARQRLTEHRVGIARALGRLGGPDQAQAMVLLLRSSDTRIGAAAAVALGVWGRRGVAFGDAARRALVPLATAADPALRYGVAYALAREHEPRRAPGVEEALLALLADDRAETRATAATGLALRKIAATEALEQRLRTDDDWRVRVEAVRALAGEAEGADGRRRVAAWAEAYWTALAGEKGALASPRVQPLVEALVVLREHADEPPIASMYETVEALARGDGERRGWSNTPAAVRARDRVHCLATAGLVRSGYSVGRVPACGEESGAGWPRHLRKLLAVEVAAARPSDAAARELLVGLAGDDDPRVRGAALAAMVGAEGAVLDDEASGFFAAAAAAEGPVVAGPVAGAVAERARGGAAVPADWMAALATRARGETSDPELRTTLVDALVAARADDARALCDAAIGDGNRTVRERAARCLAELSGADPAGADVPGSAAAPAFHLVDLAAVVGKQVRWTVKTSRGSFVIELDPATAPHSVAALSQLARDGFYDGLLWHRVVRDFVVQGGDPTGSGWGGPGWLLPAEPSLLPYDRGAVGIADAGLDTGGCQLFVMHARAPHLEGRYTRIGRVASGMAVVDALLVGDTIEGIDVAVTPEAGSAAPAGAE